MSEIDEFRHFKYKNLGFSGSVGLEFKKSEQH
jgi:hypothetical protein